ncbi:MAG: hypothetical protein LBS23_02440 [Holosporaceae bacterium]|jgi:hypothetical protein|nr:hypothetical protein [Holosporaceae bacterium]
MQRFYFIFFCIYLQNCVSVCSLNLENEKKPLFPLTESNNDVLETQNNAYPLEFPKFFCSLFKVPSSLKIESVDEEPQATVYDDAAQQLGGLRTPKNCSCIPTYEEYAKSINEAWARLNSISLSKIKEWTHIHITPHTINRVKVVFYPFGGPDIVYAIKFFPLASDYILVGLEPLGDFINIEKNLQNKSTFAALKYAFSHYLRKGYFITSEMMTQLYNKDIKGALYLILLELAKLGFRIISVENLSINADGQEVARETGMINCVKITFARSGSPFLRKAYYIKTDLSNSNKKLSYLLNFIKRRRFATFVKSASYAMHNREFSGIRDFILNNTQSLLQDDSGIPFYHFNFGWDKYIFGEYTQPTLPIFRPFKQQNLAHYYATHDKAEIPFNIGYGFEQGRPNLLLAIPCRISDNEVNTR